MNALYTSLWNCVLVDCSTPDWYALTPETQPVHMPTAASQGATCCTPQYHPPAARPETPDTAKLLQRALASNSGSALLNSLSQELTNSDPTRSVHSRVAELKGGSTVAIAAASSAAVQESVSSGAPQVSRSEQQRGYAGSAAVPSSFSQPALVSNHIPNAPLDNLRLAADGSASGPLAAASALPQGSRTRPVGTSGLPQGFQTGPVVTSGLPQGVQTRPVATSGLLQGLQTGPVAATGLLLNQHRVSQQQVQEPMASDQPATRYASHGQQLAEAEQQKQQQVDLSSSAPAGQQFGADKEARQGDQLRKGLDMGEGQRTAPKQAAAHQQPSLGLIQAAGRHAGPLQPEGPGPTAVGLAAGIAESVGHVTSQVKLSRAKTHAVSDVCCSLHESEIHSVGPSCGC